MCNYGADQDVIARNSLLDPELEELRGELLRRVEFSKHPGGSGSRVLGSFGFGEFPSIRRCR